MENVLVAGATGNTGRLVIELLNKSQYFTPVAMVRKSKQKADFERIGVQTVLGDLQKDVSHTLKDIDKVVFAAGSGGEKVEKVDQEGAKKMIDESKAHNIKRFVMLSSMGADNPEQMQELQDYLKAKKNADDYLRSSELIFTIVRPGSLTNDEPKGHIDISEKLNRQGEISRADVAQVLTRCLHDTAPKNITFEILEGETLISKALEGMQ